MTEVRLLFETGETDFQRVLDSALGDGWIPRYESFRMTNDKEYTQFAILLTRP